MNARLEKKKGQIMRRTLSLMTLWSVAVKVRGSEVSNCLVCVYRDWLQCAGGVVCVKDINCEPNIIMISKSVDKTNAQGYMGRSGENINSQSRSGAAVELFRNAVPKNRTLGSFVGAVKCVESCS
jgi:hypothetical protein